MKYTINKLNECNTVLRMFVVAMDSITRFYDYLVLQNTYKQQKRKLAIYKPVD